MKTLYFVALAIHILSVLGILGLLLAQAQKSVRKISPGVIHAGLTAGIAGIVMTSVFEDAHNDEVLNNGRVGIKFLVLVAILFLGYANSKKEAVKTWVWGTMLGLTILNILLAFTLASNK